MGNETKQPTITWRQSQTKIHLRETLLLSQEPPYWKMNPSEVWASDNCFQQYDIKNFGTNPKSNKGIQMIRLPQPTTSTTLHQKLTIVEISCMGIQQRNYWSLMLQRAKQKE
jgi:hypothetical protein